VKGNFDDPRLPAGVIDAVLILDAYHEMKDHDKILRHVWVSLKPGGRLVICETDCSRTTNVIAPGTGAQA